MSPRVFAASEDTAPSIPVGGTLTLTSPVAMHCIGKRRKTSIQKNRPTCSLHRTPLLARPQAWDLGPRQLALVVELVDCRDVFVTCIRGGVESSGSLDSSKLLSVEPVRLMKKRTCRARHGDDLAFPTLCLGQPSSTRKVPCFCGQGERCCSGSVFNP